MMPYDKYFYLGLDAEDVTGGWPNDVPSGVPAVTWHIEKEDGLPVPRKDEPESGNPKDLIGVLKPDLSLVPPAGMLYESQAMMDGAKKYGAYNWRSNPVKMRVYIAAAMRHLQQLLDGEDFDPKSGVHHLGHARACTGILCDARETGNLIDDRPVPGPAGDMIRRFEETQSFA